MSFQNKAVLVTGGSSGIGAATAILFCKEKARVAIVGRNETKLKSVAKQCAEVGIAPLVIKADVANDDDARRIIKDTIKEFGKLDVLVNNAGVLRHGTLLKGDMLEAFDEIMSINLRAVVHLTTLATPYLVKSKGNIVNISSIASHMHVVPSYVSYCTSKAGLDHFTRGCAMELGSSGVRVNAVNPGPVETDIFESSGSTAGIDKINTLLGRWSQSEEVGDLILYLASDKARSITGSIFVIDNGCRLQK